MTDQEAFDYTTRQIIAQGGQSTGYGGACAYRGDNGRRCAVGWLIPDNEYHPRMEGLPISRLPVPVLPKIASALQRAHDDAFDQLRWSWCRWREILADIAQQHDLDPAVLQEIPE